MQGRNQKYVDQKHHILVEVLLYIYIGTLCDSRNLARKTTNKAQILILRDIVIL